MKNLLTIVMYHYIRDLARSRYPAIKGLGLERFRGQLDYIQRHYNVVRMGQVIAAAQGEQDALPPHPLLLTFDDGYMDHFVNALPLLADRGMEGSFFPPAKAIAEGRVLDVNKVHFVLASVSDTGEIVDFLFQALDRARQDHDLPDNRELFDRLSRDGRYDDPNTLFVKRVLQRELPEALRAELTDTLFRRFVTEDEAAFSAELYMNRAQLRYMLQAGMFLGSHGYDHYWMNTLCPVEQRREVDLSLDFLQGLGVRRDRWVMCYPYGGYNASLLEVLRERDCAVGLTTEVALAHMERHDALTLPRLDTNDLPKAGNAPVNDWTRKALTS